MKRLMIMLLCVSVMVLSAGCGEEAAEPEQAQGNTEGMMIGNPWSDHGSLAEAEAATGFMVGGCIGRNSGRDCTGVLESDSGVMIWK